MSGSPHDTREAEWEANNLCGVCPYRIAIQQRNDALVVELDTLREALRRHGQHKPSCAANYSAHPTLDACDCGLGAALAAGSRADTP